MTAEGAARKILTCKVNLAASAIAVGTRSQSSFIWATKARSAARIQSAATIIRPLRPAIPTANPATPRNHEEIAGSGGHNRDDVHLIGRARVGSAPSHHGPRRAREAERRPARWATWHVDYKPARSSAIRIGQTRGAERRGVSCFAARVVAWHPMRDRLDPWRRWLSETASSGRDRFGGLHASKARHFPSGAYWVISAPARVMRKRMRGDDNGNGSRSRF